MRSKAQSGISVSRNELTGMRIRIFGFGYVRSMKVEWLTEQPLRFGSLVVLDFALLGIGALALPNGETP